MSHSKKYLTSDGDQDSRQRFRTVVSVFGQYCQRPDQRPGSVPEESKYAWHSNGTETRTVAARSVLYQHYVGECVHYCTNNVATGVVESVLPTVLPQYRHCCGTVVVRSPL